MGLFNFLSSKDWNVVAIIFERPDIYRVNGQRAKGSQATKGRDGVKGHDRTIFWAVFDQNRKFLEGGPGTGAKLVTPEIVKRIEKELLTIGTITGILETLESGTLDKAAKKLEWRGYPKSDD